MPRVFLQRTVYVAATEERALEDARKYLVVEEGAAVARVGGGPLAKTRVGWGSNPRGMGRDSERPDDAARGETMQRAQTDLDFQIANGQHHR
jgi:hypothetical protein